MYERMQFADFVVSSALQSLSRGLLKISESAAFPAVEPGLAAAALRCSDEKSLLQIAERLLSFWQMAQWSIGKVQFKAAQADLRNIVLLCSSDRVPELMAAEKLLERADPKSARLLGDIIDALQASRPDEDVRERLNTLLQAESARWREFMPLRQIDESDLIDHGMLRAFEKAAGLSAKLDRISTRADTGSRASAKRLQRTGRWVRHSLNHLELLRPALSESGRTRRWHLDRLAAKLDEQWALEKFARAAVVMDLKPKVSVRLDKLITEQRQRLDNQRRKLSVGAFAGGIEQYREQVTEAVQQLGLKDITLLPLEGTLPGNRGVGTS